MNGRRGRWSARALAALLAVTLAGCGDHQAKALRKLTAKGYSLSVEEFLRAARAGDAQAVRWFVEAGLEPNVPDAHHRTGLGEAVKAGQLPAVEALVAMGSTLPKEGEAAAELLRSAVSARSQPVLKFLLEHEVTGKGLKPDSVSPLAVAASLGQREALERLLPLSAGREQEALFAGAGGGDVATLSLLIRAGTNVLTRQAKSGKTALMCAAEAGRAEAVELLINAGANRWVEDDQERTALDFAEAGGHAGVVALLEAAPGVKESEAGVLPGTGHDSAPGAAQPLNGVEFRVNRALNESVVALLKLRGCREEMVPVMLDGVEDGKTMLRVLPDGEAGAQAEGSPIGGTGWILERVRMGEDRPAAWWCPQVSIRNPRNGLRLALVRGLPGRSGRTVAVLEFGPAREVHEGLPGDAFAISGATTRHFVLDVVAPLAVELHDTAAPAVKIVLKAGALK